MEITVFIPAFLLVTKLQAVPYKIGTEAMGDRSMFATYTGSLKDTRGATASSSDFVLAGLAVFVVIRPIRYYRNLFK